MAAEILILDPTSENAANVPLTLTSGSYGLTEHRYPQPAIDPQWASSSSTEGAALASQRHQNREIAITVEVDCTTNLTPLRTLQAKLTKLAGEGGTLQRTMSDATVIVFDVLTCDGYDPSFDQAWHLGSITTVSFTLQCKPFGRGTEQTLTSHTETTLPALVFTETGIKGDLLGTGRLVITEAQAQDQWWAVWGLESRYYNSAASAALFWQAEALTAQGGSATAVGTAASGAGSNVMRNVALATAYQSVLSTTSSGGTAMTHIGTFKVYTRVMAPATNTGVVTVALDWTRTGFRQSSRNVAVSLNADWEGSWQVVDLGVVTLPAGTTSWEGRLVASSTVSGDGLDVDCLMIVPVEEGHGDARGLAVPSTPTAFTARDNFNTTGTLNAKTLPVGGTWATSGATTDYTYSTTILNQTYVGRSTGTDTGPRFGLAGTTTLAGIEAGVDLYLGGDTTSEQGLLLRYVDASNYATATLGTRVTTGLTLARVTIVIAGVKTTLASSVVGAVLGTSPSLIPYALRARIDAGGRFLVWVGRQGQPLSSTPLFGGSHTSLATGGTLATGKFGLHDYTSGVGGALRAFMNFFAFVPAFDAAMFASQTLEVRSDKVLRENSAGTELQPVSYYAGDYLRVPVAGAEARTLRVIVKASRNNPDYGPDTGIDDISAQLFYTPRWLNVPSA